MEQRAGAWTGVAVLVVVVLVSMALLGPAAASNRDRDDHNRARQAVESGQVLPLKAILARVEREHPGDVLEVELEQDDGVWLYEIKVLQAGGVLKKLKLDARTGAVLKTRAQRAGSRERERGRDNERERD